MRIKCWIACSTVDCDDYYLFLCSLRLIAVLVIFRIQQEGASDSSISLHQRFLSFFCTSIHYEKDLWKKKKEFYHLMLSCECNKLLMWLLQVTFRKKYCPLYSSLPVSLICVGILFFIVYLITCLKMLFFPVCPWTLSDSTVMYSLLVWLPDLVYSCILLQRVKQVSRRLICSVATEDLPKEVEKSNMETPREIFLKDYKMPDYYFDTVSLQKFLDYVSSTFLVLSKIYCFFCSCVAWNYYRWI